MIISTGLALGSTAFYVGALGSRKTHEKRRQRLLEAGVGEAAFDRIDGPIGLPIGAFFGWLIYRRLWPNLPAAAQGRSGTG